MVTTVSTAQVPQAAKGHTTMATEPPVAIATSTFRLYLQSTQLAPEKFSRSAIYFTERQGGLGLRPAHL